MRRLAIIAGIVVALFGLAYAGVAAHDKLAIARFEAARARDSVTAALQIADNAIKAANRSLDAADSADAARAAAEHRAALAEQHAATVRAAYNTAEHTAPDTCKPVLAAADSLIAAQDSTIADLHVALASDSTAQVKLRAALDTTHAALLGLQKPAAALVVADKVLSVASRKPIWRRLLPDPGIGATAGYDLRGRPNIVTGISLSWHF